MKVVKYLVAFLLCLFTFNKKSFGQSGCLVNSNIYSNPAPVALGVNLFSDLKLYTIPGQATSCFSGTISTSTACFVCEQGGEISSAVSLGSLLYLITCNKKTNALGLGPYYSATSGVYYSNYAFVCPLDDYTFALSAAAGLFGIIIIRRNRTQ